MSKRTNVVGPSPGVGSAGLSDNSQMAVRLQAAAVGSGHPPWNAPAWSSKTHATKDIYKKRAAEHASLLLQLSFCHKMCPHHRMRAIL
eukprot:1161145-Pelagomonas_calceolata.AAC.7